MKACWPAIFHTLRSEQVRHWSCFPDLTADNTNPTGFARRSSLRPYRSLSQVFSVYLVNRRPGLPPETTIADMAGDYAQAIQHEFSQPVSLLGVSTGGSIAQQLAVDYPHLVRRLVLMSTACRLSPYGRFVQRRLARLIASSKPRRAWASLGPAMAATPIGGHLMAAPLWLFGGAMTPANPSDLLVTISAEDAFDISPDLYRITAPTLLIAGEHDHFYSPELFHETADRIQDACLHLYPDKGHAGVITQTESFHEAIHFLARPKNS